MQARLISKGWVKREVEVFSPNESYIVEYNGKGMGYESVSVNGIEVARENSPIWFVPEFNFKLGNRLAIVKVFFWPWFCLRKFKLIVDDKIIYQEPYNHFDLN